MKATLNLSKAHEWALRKHLAPVSREGGSGASLPPGGQGLAVDQDHVSAQAPPRVVQQCSLPDEPHYHILQGD